MSIFLYRLGAAIARRRGLVLGAWILVFAGFLGGAALLGDHYDDSFSIPGTQSQEGQDLLRERFDQTGTSGQIILTASSGKITDAANATSVGKVVDAIGKVPHVALSNPLTADHPLVSTDSTSTLGQIRFSQQVPSDDTLQAVQRAGRPPTGSGLSTSVGGDAYKATNDPSKVPELLGLLVSFVILALTFGSLLTAGMPIVTSLIGVGVTLSAVVVVSSFVTVSSSSPTLAEMLGLAVGIDYALFILSRHRSHLADGVSPTESMARALATAGSAVVFAGATVIIALTGLSVARIPVLTVMGLAAAAAVAMAVLIALTLLPAIALLLGERLRPRPKRARRRPDAAPRLGFANTWVHLATRRPVLTILAVLVLLTLAAVPALSLRLALPDNSTAPTSTPQRQTYDDITEAFGEGYNAPLSLTADVITSSDPKGTVSKLADAIGKVPGVVAITQETPDAGGDTALIQAIPVAGQTAPSTSALVNQLRVRSPALEKTYGVHDILVTGPTAINIDVSARLGSALLPFGAIVIGLSLILLMIVFRSIAVPLKATFGYLLSVGAALGAVVVVFQWGWLDGVLPGLTNGPVVSFLPIFVMGVLFGLAMDYEMFLVSAMREDYVHTGDAHQAVYRGFKASSRVVTAAALIMVSVFTAFIPGGSSTIKPIAFGLAFGVFVDAFIVRMTFVPAVLVLLDRRAWWLPTWLDKRVPVVDVEGAALHRKIEFDDWEAAHGETTLLAKDLVLTDGADPVQFSVGPGVVNSLVVPDDATRLDLGLAMAGRRKTMSGELVVAGLLLPEQRELVNTTSTLIELDRGDLADNIDDQIEERARLASMSARRRRGYVQRTHDTVDQMRSVLDGEPTPVIRAAVVEAALAVQSGVRVIVLTGSEDLSERERDLAGALATDLARRGLTVMLLERGSDDVRLADPPGRNQPGVLASSAVNAGQGAVHEEDPA